jgi:hypothetical protein
MKNSTIIIIVTLVVLMLILGIVVMRNPNLKNIQGLPGGNSSSEDPVSPADSSELDKSVNEINTSDLSDNALNDLG